MKSAAVRSLLGISLAVLFVQSLGVDVQRALRRKSSGETDETELEVESVDDEVTYMCHKCKNVDAFYYDQAEGKEGKTYKNLPESCGEGYKCTFSSEYDAWYFSNAATGDTTWTMTCGGVPEERNPKPNAMCLYELQRKVGECNEGEEASVDCADAKQELNKFNIINNAAAQTETYMSPAEANRKAAMAGEKHEEDCKKKLRMYQAAQFCHGAGSGCEDTAVWAKECS
eukprot:g623.t1